MNIDRKQFILKLQLEILWWVITAIATFLVIYPILDNMVKFQFLYANILFIIVFITYTRHIFLLKYTFLAYWQWVKFALIFLSIPLVFKLVEFIFNFQDFLDTEGLQSFSTYFREGIKFETQQNLLNYMKREYVFFGVGSVIAAIVLPFRMLISFWRVYNKEKTV